MWAPEKLSRAIVGSSLLVAAAVAAVGVVVACSSAPAAAPAAGAPTQAAAPAQGAASGGDITFGLVAPMTGDAADYGIMLESGVRLAADEINAAGGIGGKKIQIKVGDDKCDPYEASLVAQRMAGDSSLFAVIGHVCSSCTLAGGPIYEKAGITAMTVSSSNPEITKKGWTHVFRTIAHDGKQGPIMAEFAAKTLNKKRMAIMYANTDYGKGLLDATVPEVPKFGGEIVAKETYVPGVDKDFASQLTRIAQAKPDVLLLLTDYAEGGLIAKQRLAAGLKDVALIASAANQHEQFLKLGGDGAEGAYIMVYFDPEKPDQMTQDFVKKYQAKYNKMPSEQAGYGYEAPYIFKMAIDKGATKDTLHKTLHSIEYTGLTGVTKFDDTGDVSGKGQAVLIVKNGKMTSYK